MFVSIYGTNTTRARRRKATKAYSSHRGCGICIGQQSDEKELADLILEKLSNPDSPEKLEEISQTLTNNYNPENLARQYMEIFSSLS